MRLPTAAVLALFAAISSRGVLCATTPGGAARTGNNATEMAHSLAKVLDFYNTELLRVNWERVKGNVSEGCEMDVQRYIEGLEAAKGWALKMDDASGKYSTGWYWGNYYWTGSQNLCEHIAPTNTRETFYNRTKRATANNASPSQAIGYQPGPLVYTSVPPFPISFFVLRVHVDTEFTHEQRLLQIGLCMPHICTGDDVKNIFERVAGSSKQIRARVENVRSRHDYYNFWADPTFQILCVASFFVTVLLIAGTAYETYLSRLSKKKNRSKLAKLGETATVITLSDASLKNSDCTTNNERVEESTELNPKPQKLNYKKIIKMVLKDCLLAFSVRTNLKAICDQSVGSDTIPVIHGLKTISMAWVILGHTCIIAFKYSDNMEYRKVVQKDFLFQTIVNGAFSVDTFFFTSGLLVSFLYFRTNAKGKLDTLTKGSKSFGAGMLQFFGLIVYRFARLTAPYLFVLGVVEVCMKWFNYNSVFEPPTMDHVNCPKYWWRNILYINTLFPVEEMCMLWSWYLSDDTQFYVVGAVLLILATSHFKTAAGLLVTFMLSSWITTAYIAFSNNHIPNFDDPMALFDKIYDKPWTRFGPYLIGMGVGWLLFKTDCRIRMSKLAVIVGWLISTACLLSLVYGLYEVDLSPVTGAAYSSLSHSAWALGLAWIVVACSTGHGGWANKVLSSTILYPFSRVTYCAYLLHPIVIRVMMMTMDHPLHLGTIVMIIIFFGQVVASYILSFIISIAFEAPVVSMLRILTKLAPSHRIKN